jgi:hypothetical protein
VKLHRGDRYEQNAYFDDSYWSWSGSLQLCAKKQYDPSEHEKDAKKGNESVILILKASSY